jgi:hypothetical protein
MGERDEQFRHIDADLLSTVRAERDAAMQDGAYDIWRLTMRLPRPVKDDLERLAKANDVSLNQMMASMIDRYLRDHGRPGLLEAAPWYLNYLMRK